VKDSRPSEDSAAIRRRRICTACGGRFTTFERVQLRELVVVKRSGRRVPFDRDKLERSIEISLRKRPVEPERVERMVSGIVRKLRIWARTTSGPDHRAPVMEALKALDNVAYVRFCLRVQELARPRVSRRCSANSATDDDDAGDGRRPPYRRLGKDPTSPMTERRGPHGAGAPACAAGLGQTWPNPSVGAIVVAARRGRRPRLDGARIGLTPSDCARRAGAKAQGATLYVA
jgi:transcriptional repressor NrdR